MFERKKRKRKEREENLLPSSGFNFFFFFYHFLRRRAKEKRLKKDAGRTRWSQYFRSMKGTGAGGHSPRHDKLLDKDELKVDLDSTFGHHGTYRYRYSHYANTFATCEVLRLSDTSLPMKTKKILELVANLLTLNIRDEN